MFKRCLTRDRSIDTRFWIKRARIFYMFPRRWSRLSRSFLAHHLQDTLNCHDVFCQSPLNQKGGWTKGGVRFFGLRSKCWFYFETVHVLLYLAEILNPFFGSPQDPHWLQAGHVHLLAGDPGDSNGGMSKRGDDYVHVCSRLVYVSLTCLRQLDLFIVQRSKTWLVFRANSLFTRPRCSFHISFL